MQIARAQFAHSKPLQYDTLRASNMVVEVAGLSSDS